MSDETLIVVCACREHLRQGELKAQKDQEEAESYFRKWAQSRVAAAEHMNIGSGAQIQQLLFSGAANENRDKGTLALERSFKVQALRQCGCA